MVALPIIAATGPGTGEDTCATVFLMALES
jgi:hypothetical protein